MRTSSRSSTPAVGIVVAIAVVVVALLASSSEFGVDGCEVDRMGNGCRIYNGQCQCGYGCRAEYRYENLEQCRLSLSGESRNACHIRSRCLNEGRCLQITSRPGYRCSCEGTGYYGLRCEKPCPAPDTSHYRGSFPYECIVI